MEQISLTGMELLGLLFGAAVASSVITLAVLWVAVRFHYGPEMERRLDERMRTGIQLIQEGIRERVRERARDLARTGIGIFAGRRAGREYEDDQDS